ncbi:MAG: aspartate/glutamate racemase family protein [Acetobacterales bacterium]
MGNRTREGYTRRIGVLVPPANVAVENEFPYFLPDGVGCSFSRLYRKSREVTVEGHREMLQSTEASALSVAQSDPGVILFACTSASFMDGLGADEALAARITKATGIPAIATATCVSMALKAVGARKVFMVTPYRDDLNKLEREFYTAAGFDIVDLQAMSCRTTTEIRELPSRRAADLIATHKATLAGCDSIFISCTNLHTMDRIAEIEQATGLPVVTSNQATLWAGLRAVGASGRGLGAGRLLESLGAAAAQAAE